jgi:class 3 adenylate cyclase
VTARVAAVGAVLLPLVVIAWLALDPEKNASVIVPNEHFYIVTLVSLLAAVVALLVARAALHLRQFQPLLVALGFLTMAVFFTVHALHTPGIMFGGGYGGYGHGTAYSSAEPIDYGGTVVGLSGFLSVFLAAFFFFAASRPPIAEGIRRVTSAGALTAAVFVGVVAYAALAAWQTEWVANLPLSKPPYAYGVVGAGVALLLVAAWYQYRAYRRSRRPVEGALAVAYVLLAEAQAMMVLTPWSLMWWQYHVLMLAAVITALTALIVELERRRGLERFLPAEVVERVVTGDLLRLAGERRTVTILFADLRNSTSLAEELPAEQVVHFTNTYVAVMARAVFAHDGMLDKFLGDGLMALFGVLDHDGDGAEAAVRAALEMQERAREVSGVARTRVGVGIHTGEVVLGSVGIPQRSDFTAIGDPVNTAARIQSELTKQFDVDVVISRQVAERLPSDAFRLRALGEATLRGKREPIEVFAVEV